MLKLLLLKLTILFAFTFGSSNASATIKLVKSQRSSVEVDASQPIDESYIQSLDEPIEEPLFDPLANNEDEYEELDIIDEFQPNIKMENRHKLKRQLTSSELENSKVKNQN